MYEQMQMEVVCLLGRMNMLIFVAVVSRLGNAFSWHYLSGTSQGNRD